MLKKDESAKKKYRVNTEMDNDETPLVNPYYVKSGFFITLSILVILLILLGIGYATNYDPIKNLAPLFAPIMATFIGIIALYYTLIIYRYKIIQVKLENNIREKAKEHIGKITNEIANKISGALIETPDWFARYMDEIGATFSASIFGKRFKYFYFEKKAIAKEVIGELDNLVNENNDTKYYLIIESGTTMFSLFPEITRHLLGNEQTRNKWRKRIVIFTNNLPGAQYLMKNCKENPSDDHSEMAINCFLMPGKVNSNLAATECDSDFFITTFDPLKKDKNNKIIGFLTGHHLAFEKDQFCPVTSEEPHKDIKAQIAKISHEIYLIAPLMQFSFADCSLLNEVYKKLKKDYKEYKAIIVEEGKQLKIFTTTRDDTRYKFYKFSENLHFKLKDLYKEKYEERIKIARFNLFDYIKCDSEPDQIYLEIPDEKLKSSYNDFLYNKKEGINIWSKEWCDAQKG